MWEDYQGGMWKTDVDNQDWCVEMATKHLSSPNEFYESALRMIAEWKIAAQVNLTNNSCNKKAWIGQASCCYKYGVPEYLTRIAWNQLTKEIQDAANDVAQKVINKWMEKVLYES